MTKKIDYQTQLDKILNELAQGSRKKQTLLLHACCAPCSSYVLEYLASCFAITVYYYNPNIFPSEEYNRRLSELKNFLPRFSPALENSVQLVQAHYEPHEFENAVRVAENPALADEAERGERCRRCYELRMTHAYEYAAAHNFDWFTTTLSISPFKDTEKINKIGEALERTAREQAFRAACECTEQGGNMLRTIPRFLTSDFKKRNGFKRSLELSSEYGLYRQDYCGCQYSMHYTSREET